LLRIGVDIGGSKTEIVALDDNGAEWLRRRGATPHVEYRAALEALAEMIVGAERELGERATIGIGHPGTISARTGLIKNAYVTPYNGQPLKRDLETLLAREIRFENDANCFALSEALDGAAAGAQSVFGVILGTGCGGGIVLNSRIVAGANRLAGEWGHNPLPWMTQEEFPGPLCYCGRTGCIERFVSGPALADDHARATGSRLEPAQIATRASAGEKNCLRTLERYERRLARALAHVINLLDPDVIVLGGGLSAIERLYENVPRWWSEYVYSDAIDTALVPAMHGDSSGVRGAARLW